METTSSEEVRWCYSVFRAASPSELVCNSDYHIVMQYSLSEAKARLSELVDRAVEGQEVIITRNGKPVVKLDHIVVRSGRLLGRHRGQVEVPPDESFQAMTPEETDAFWEGR